MKRAIVLVLGLALLAPATAQAAKPAKVTGKLTGAKLPSAGNGRVVVWALRLSNGIVVDSTSAKRGRFTLETPKGAHAILATVVPERGRKEAVHRVADFVTAKSGKRTKIKPTLKKRKKARASARARAAWKNVGYPVIWVHRWTVTAGDRELKVLEKGMQDMIITDLVAKVGTPDCPGAISAGDDLDKVLSEIKLSQSKYFDESTRMTTKNLLRPNAMVNGTMTQAGDQLTITATYVHAKSGKQGTVTVTGARDRVFELETQLVDKLARLICGGVPKTYSGTFSGTWTTDLNDLDISWTGDIVLELSAESGYEPPVAHEPGTWANYVVRSGQVHAKLQGTRGVCTAAGEATFALPTGTSNGVLYVRTDDERPWFHLEIVGPPTQEIPYTETGVGCQQNPSYPLAFVPFVFTELPLQANDLTALSGNTSMRRYGSTSHFTSAFSLAGGD